MTHRRRCQLAKLQECLRKKYLQPEGITLLLQGWVRGSLMNIGMHARRHRNFHHLVPCELWECAGQGGNSQLLHPEGPCRLI